MRLTTLVCCQEAHSGVSGHKTYSLPWPLCCLRVINKLVRLWDSRFRYREIWCTPHGPETNNRLPFEVKGGKQNCKGNETAASHTGRQASNQLANLPQLAVKLVKSLWEMLSDWKLRDVVPIRHISENSNLSIYYGIE